MFMYNKHVQSSWGYSIHKKFFECFLCTQNAFHAGDAKIYMILHSTFKETKPPTVNIDI